MSAYVLTKKTCRDLSFPTSHALSIDDEETIAVFTGRGAAEKYLRDVGWARDHEVREVTAVQLFELIVSAHHEGVSYVAVNPDGGRQLASAGQAVIVIEQQIAGFAEQLTREVVAKRLEAATVRGEPLPTRIATY